MNARVTVPAEPREVDINEASVNASALWQVIDHLENLMGDATDQEAAFAMVHVARQLARQLDLDLRALQEVI